MFGLPILRKKSDLEFPINWTYTVGDPLALAGPLAEMSGNHYSLGVCVNWKDMLGWGNGFPASGVLGFAGSSSKPKLATINRAIDPTTGLPDESRIIKVRSHGNFTIILTAKGFLYGTGFSKTGLFNKNVASKSYTSYTLITDKVKHFDIGTPDVYGDNSYMLIVKEDGKVYGLGSAFKAFGLGETNLGPFYTLTYLGIDNADKVFCTAPNSQGKSFVLKKDKTVWACGYNTDGCLGLNFTTTSIVYTWAQVKKREVNNGTVSDLTNVVDLITTNFVYVGGANSSATTWTGGNGNTHMASYFLTSDGYVYTCGNNKFGQLGLGYDANAEQIKYVATKISSSYNNVVNLSGVTKIASSAGGTSILAATSDNKLYSWGNNQWGQLGTGDLVHKTSPQDVTLPGSDLIMQINGGYQSGIINGAFLVLTNIGEIYAAGFNQTYALGIVDNTPSHNPVEGPIKTFTKNYYFGPNSPSNLIASNVDLCGYGTEMAQKVLLKGSGNLYMSGWNQNGGSLATSNFNPSLGQNVSVPSLFILTN